MKRNLLFLLFCLSLFLVHSTTQAQYTNKKVKSKYEQYNDSLKQVEYNYIFPIWGQKAYKAGFDIPYPAGIMGNFMWMQQGLVFENFKLGLKTDNVDIPLTEVDFIRFGENSNTSYTVNVRPDIWVFPFLNLYGIFGYGNSDTKVEIEYPLTFTSEVSQGIQTAGVGLLTAFGVGPVWVSIDANWTWNKPELLTEPVNVTVLGLRIGHTFTFASRPDRNFALWAGAMHAKMGTKTSGEIRLGDALPQDVWDRRDEFVDNYYEWYDAIPPTEPGKKVIADQVLTPIVERVASRDGDAVVRYSMDKQVQELWNGIFGAQFQLNKHWMFRSEAGLIGNRKSFLASINYRFLL